MKQNKFKKKTHTLCKRPLVLPSDGLMAMSTLSSITCRLFMSNSTVIRSESLGLLWFTVPLLEQVYRHPFRRLAPFLLILTSLLTSPEPFDLKV